MNLKVSRTVNRTIIHFFYSYPSITTTTATYNATNYQLIQNYTLYEQALAYYNITSADELNEYIADNPDWYSEHERVCVLNLNNTLPTVPFNTNIVISTYAPVSSSVFSSSIGATAGATSTVSSSATTPSATTNISTNGLCVSDNNGYVCTGSEIGDCCSNYGYCGSTSEYCSSVRQPTFILPSR